jgi:hypothetical protein
MHPVRPFVSVVAIALALVAFAHRAAAAESHPCAATVEPSERLACYDKAFPPGPGARFGDVGMTAADREAQRLQAQRDFGLNRTQAEERKPEAEREYRPDRIDATITKIGYRATGERVVSLDNGQVWLIIEVTEKGFLKAGDRVALKKGLIGTTYMLDTGRINLRARRLQ